MMQSLGVNNGKYTLVSQIHHGEAADIFRARVDGDCGFKKLVAIKQLPPDRINDGEARRRIVRQAVIGSKLGHHNMVGVYDFHQGESGLYLAMELVEGSTLAAILTYQQRIHQPFALASTLKIITQLLDALDYLHRARDPLSNERLHVVHRDVRPVNILVEPSGVTKLLGFGRCQFKGEAGGKRGERWLSPYSAPEMLEDRQLNPSADIFSLGAILYEMLTLEPFLTQRDRNARAQEIRNLSLQGRFDLLSTSQQALRPILKRALAIEPDARYDSARAMAREIRPLIPPLATGDFTLRDIVERAMNLACTETPPASDGPQDTTDGVLVESADWSLFGNHIDDLSEDDLSEDDLEDDDDFFDELEELEAGAQRSSRDGLDPRTTFSKTVNLATEPWAKTEDSKETDEASPYLQADEEETLFEGAQETRVSSFNFDDSIEPIELEPSQSEADLADCLEPLEPLTDPKSEKDPSPPQETALVDPHQSEWAASGQRLAAAPPPAPHPAFAALESGYHINSRPELLNAQWSHKARQTQSSDSGGLTLCFLAPGEVITCQVPYSGLTLGRAHSNDVIIADLDVAPRHATIVWESGRWWIRAQRGEWLKSNGRLVVEAALEPGILIQLGHIQFATILERTDPPPDLLDFGALVDELSENFPALLSDEQFRQSAGLPMELDPRSDEPRANWSDTLATLRSSPQPRLLRRTLEEIVKLHPNAIRVREALRCLRKLDQWG